ncbi:tubulin-specific chaperone C-like [Argopecten irradians]|uniref:tubulin-specific chaperone C-like n=1 Tax=Argopecten irradians TaxID=31199 RepID=UPI0037237C85
MEVNGDHHDISVDKKAIVTDRLQKRELERQEDIQRRKDEKDNSANAKESTRYFSDNFNIQRESVEGALATCNGNCSDKVILRERFDFVAQSYQKLQKFVADSVMFLPSYDLRQAQETLGKLQAQIQEKREQMLPKKKFAFSSRKKVEKDPQVMTNGAHKMIEKSDKLGIELAGCKIIGFQGVTLVKNSSDITGKDVAVANLNDCTLKLFGAPSTVHMKNLKNCTILCGPVSSSVFISDCEECVFVLACQQLRTHTTKNSSVYLHVTSRAIIEDCKDLDFAPYSLSYPGQNDHFDRSGIDKKRNNWNDVDDFNWLASDVRSPNWTIMEEDKRKNFLEE